MTQQYIVPATERFGARFPVSINGDDQIIPVGTAFTPEAGVLHALDNAGIAYELATKGSATGNITIPGSGSRVSPFYRNGAIESAVLLNTPFAPDTTGDDLVVVLTALGIDYETEYAEQALAALTLDTDEIDDDALEDAVVGTLQDITDGSTLALTSDESEGMFKLVVDEIQVTDMTLVADTYTLVVTETLPGATGSPKASSIDVTVNVAA